MRISRAAVVIALPASLMVASPATSKGCIRGALVGGVAGHYAGHHALAGAAGTTLRRVIDIDDEEPVGEAEEGAA